MDGDIQCATGEFDLPFDIDRKALDARIADELPGCRLYACGFYNDPRVFVTPSHFKFDIEDLNAKRAALVSRKRQLGNSVTMFVCKINFKYLLEESAMTTFVAALIDAGNRINEEECYASYCSFYRDFGYFPEQVCGSFSVNVPIPDEIEDMDTARRMLAEHNPHWGLSERLDSVRTCNVILRRSRFQ